MADIKRTPQRNKPGATRGAVPPKKPALVKAVNNQTGKVEYAKTPNSGAARAKVISDRNKANKALQTKRAPQQVENTPGKRLGGQTKATKVKSPTRSGAISIKRGAQERAVTKAQGIRAAGGVPLPKGSNATSLKVYPVRLPDGTVFDVLGSPTRYSRLSPDVRSEALLRDAYAQRQAAEEAARQSIKGGKVGSARATHNLSTPVRSGKVPAPARAAAAAGKSVNAAGNLARKGANAVKGSGAIKGVSTATGVAATVGRTAARYAGPALMIGDALERSNRGQNFVQRAIPTAGVSGAAGWAGARAGSVAGAKLGSMLGPKGALIGGALGGIGGGLIGYGTGGSAMDALYDANSKGSKNKSKPQATTNQQAKAPNGAGNRSKGTASNQVADYTDAQGNVYDGSTGRLKTPRFVSPASSAPIHAPTRALRPTPREVDSVFVGSSAVSPVRPSTPAQVVQQQQRVAPASETYRDGGKGLYQGTEEYRKAIGGSGNPLLNRFRQDMGLKISAN